MILCKIIFVYAHTYIIKDVVVSLTFFGIGATQRIMYSFL